MNIETLLNNYTFPIVACIFLLYVLKNVIDNSNKEEKENRKVINKLSDTIAKNTLAVNELCKIIKYNFEKSKEKGGDNNETK